MENETVENEVIENEEQVIEEVENEPTENEHEAEVEQEESETNSTEEDEGSLNITFEGESPHQDNEEGQGTDLVKHLRKTAKEKAKENKKLMKELEELRATQTKPKEEIVLQAKPTLADADYDEEVYESKLTSWYEQKRQVEKQEQDKKDEQNKQQEDWQNTINSYETKKQELKVKDYDDAEENVKLDLDATQQGVLLSATLDPALVVYAIGKNDAQLKELSKIKDPIKFAAAVARLETKMKTNRTTKAKTPPEKKITGGGSMSGSDAKASRLLKAAVSSGDMTEYRKYMKSKKQK